MQSFLIIIDLLVRNNLRPAIKISFPKLLILPRTFRRWLLVCKKYKQWLIINYCNYTYELRMMGWWSESFACGQEDSLVAIVHRGNQCISVIQRVYYDLCKAFNLFLWNLILPIFPNWHCLLMPFCISFSWNNNRVRRRSYNFNNFLFGGLDQASIPAIELSQCIKGVIEANVRRVEPGREKPSITKITSKVRISING